jgi:hypothetical protein
MIVLPGVKVFQRPVVRDFNPFTEIDKVEKYGHLPQS